MVNQRSVATLDKNKIVKVIRMGHLVEVLQMDYIPSGGQSITKLDDDYYIVNATGEIKTYKHTTRQDISQSLRRTIKHIRLLINNNFGNLDSMVTLTYALQNGKPMTDTKKLQHDMDVFIKCLRRRIKDLKYLYVIEPQQSGAWHCHMLINGVHDIDYKSLWAHGTQIDIETFAGGHCDNIGAYLSAYLTNTTDKKGERLHFYPTNTNIYRASRNVKMPVAETMTVEELNAIIGTNEPTYATSFVITDNTKNPVNTVTKHSYNLNRPTPLKPKKEINKLTKKHQKTVIEELIKIIKSETTVVSDKLLAVSTLSDFTRCDHDK